MPVISAGLLSPIKSIQQVTASMAAVGVTDVTITAVNLSKTFVAFGGVNPPVAYAQSPVVSMFLSSTTNLRFTMGNSGGATSGTAYATVVEYN